MTMRNNWLFTAALMVGVSLATLGGMKGISDSQKTESKSSTKSLTTTASFRDGAYIGKRAADLGEKFHIAIGRWANESDRLNYAAGYESAYNLSQAAKSMPSGDLAAFRDGLYLGKLDADHG